MYCFLRKCITYLSIFLFLVACENKQEPIALAGYYWKTNYKLSDTEQQFLDENAIHKIYIRYFDIGIKNEQAIPIEPIDFKDKTYLSFEIVPVVYIKNEVFIENVEKPEILAEKTADYINQINRKHQIKIKEIQIDCDWSLTTKEAYFEFLESLKKHTTADLSATIRLHQVKYYEKTGIPPVKTGVLMYYNMGDLFLLNQNSIYNAETANKYIKNLKNYPLPLDFALPIFSWAVQFRNNKIVNVVGGLKTLDIKKIENLEEIENNKYRVTKETVYEGRIWQTNDILKIEEITEKDLKEMSETLQKYSNFPPKTFILYDIKESNIKNYEKDIFKTISKRN